MVVLDEYRQHRLVQRTDPGQRRLTLFHSARGTCTLMHSQDRTRQRNRRAPGRTQHMPVRLSSHCNLIVGTPASLLHGGEGVVDLDC